MSILPFYFPSSSSSSPSLRLDSLVVSLHLDPSRRYWLIRISGILYASPFLSSLYSEYSWQLLPANLVVQVEQSVQYMCLTMCPDSDSEFRTKSALARWFILTTSRSYLKIKVTGQQSSRYRVEKCFFFDYGCHLRDDILFLNRQRAASNEHITRTQL